MYVIFLDQCISSFNHFSFCIQLIEQRTRLGRVGFVTQLHAWWHLGTGASVFSNIILMYASSLLNPWFVRIRNIIAAFVAKVDSASQGAWPVVRDRGTVFQFCRGHCALTCVYQFVFGVPQVRVEAVKQH